VLTLPPSVRIYVATEPVDCRKSFDGLAAATRSVLGQDPLSGHLFVFFNRRKDQVRILVWDRNGFAMWCKRLERGVFKLPSEPRAGESHLDVEASELALILEGIDLAGAKRRRRWEDTVEVRVDRY
jgi:transposase